MDTFDPNDEGPLINVAMWISLVSSILAVACKLYTKWSAAKHLQSDDIVSIISLLLTVGLSVSISEEITYGLGETMSSLSPTQFESFLKARYTSNILYVVTVASTKLIGLCFYTNICTTDNGRYVVRVFQFFLPLWLLVALLTLSFQCGVPQPWNIRNDHCIDLQAFWTVNCVIDIITQIVISFLPVFLLSSLHTKSSSVKWVAMVAFIPNIATVPLTILRLIYLDASDHSSDLTKDAYNATLLTALHGLLGVIFACIPFIKPIVDSLVSEVHLIINETGASLTSSRGHIGYPSGPATPIRRSGLVQYSSPKSFNSARDAAALRWPHASISSVKRDTATESGVDDGDILLGNISSISAGTRKHSDVVEQQLEISRADNNDTHSEETMVIRQTKTMTVTTQEF